MQLRDTTVTLKATKKKNNDLTKQLKTMSRMAEKNKAATKIQVRDVCLGFVRRVTPKFDAHTNVLHTAQPFRMRCRPGIGARQLAKKDDALEAKLTMCRVDLVILRLIRFKTSKTNNLSFPFFLL